jgi:hypothetical protein
MRGILLREPTVSGWVLRRKRDWLSPVGDWPAETMPVSPVERIIAGTGWEVKSGTGRFRAVGRDIPGAEGDHGIALAARCRCRMKSVERIRIPRSA